MPFLNTFENKSSPVKYNILGDQTCLKEDQTHNQETETESITERDIQTRRRST